MKWRDFLERWSLSSLALESELLEAKFDPRKRERAAAWELYVELLTRVTTQALPARDGDEQSALDSVLTLFQLTREILKRQGPGSGESRSSPSQCSTKSFARSRAIGTASLSLSGAFSNAEQCRQFRVQLAELQSGLTHFARALADMARVEDLTEQEGPAR